TLEGEFGREGVFVLPGRQQAWIPLTTADDSPAIFDLKSGYPAERQPEAGEPTRWNWVAPKGGAVCVRYGSDHALRDFFSDQLLTDLPGLREPLGFTPDGRALLGRDETNRLQRWDTATGKPVYPEPEFPTHTEITTLAFRPDGRSLVSGCSV